MIAEKRKARVPPKPVLVVQPGNRGVPEWDGGAAPRLRLGPHSRLPVRLAGGGAVVAFKIKTEMYSAPSAPEDQIKANMSGGADEDGGKEDELAPAGPGGTGGAGSEEGAGPQNQGSEEDQAES